MVSSVTAPSSTAAAIPERSRGLIAALVVFAAMACNTRQDPYTKATLALEGSVQHGGQMFRINCAGCHGIAGQGLVGPSLKGVSERRKDMQIIHQVVSGETPPMPRFEIEPQNMADLLAYLKTLS